MLTGCLADYQNPVPWETLEFEIRIAVAEASDLEFVPPNFRNPTTGVKVMHPAVLTK